MIRPPQVWHTPRLHLRPPALEDAERLFASYVQDPEVTRYLPWRPHRSLGETRAFLERCVAVWEDGSAFPWVLELTVTRELIGMAEARVRPPAVELGYVLARTHWGRGLMTEALQPVVDWGLSQSEIFRVWAVCDVANVPSARVLERLGFQCEGVLRRWISHPNVAEAPRDALCYSRVR